MAIARLPVPGEDGGTWGEILNEFLLVSHNNDGSIRAGAVPVDVSEKADKTYVDAQIATRVASNDPRLSDTRTPNDNSVATAKLQDESVTEAKLAIANAPTNGHFLSWNGSTFSWQPQASAPVQTVAGKTGDVTLVKTDVGLGNVDNTSDLGKPISTATQAALNTKADTSSLSSVAASGSYADLTNKPTLPSAGTTSGTYAAGNDTRITGALQTSVVTAKGDILAATGSGAINRLAVGGDGQVLTADAAQPSGVKWSTPASAPVSSVAGRTGAVTLSTADVSGLSTVATSGSYADLSNKPTIPSAGTGLTSTSGVLSVNYGTTGTTAAAGNDARITGALQTSTVTTKGDLLVATGSGSLARVGVGSDTQVLTADSSQPGGVKWSAVASGGGGITRSIELVSSNLVGEAAPLTDYVYIITGNYTFTLPTASGNNNVYTIKNRHTANIAIGFQPSETADDGAGITLNANSSVTLVSDGTDWIII